MSNSARAKRKPKKSRPSRKKLRPSVFDLADDMETPLHRTEDLIRALEYIGYGLSSLGEDGAPAVFAVAQALSANHEAVKKSWERLFGQAAENK